MLFRSPRFVYCGCGTPRNPHVSHLSCRLVLLKRHLLVHAFHRDQPQICCTLHSKEKDQFVMPGSKHHEKREACGNVLWRPAQITQLQGQPLETESPQEHLKVDRVLICKLGKNHHCSVAAYEFLKTNEYHLLFFSSSVLVVRMKKTTRYTCSREDLKVNLSIEQNGCPPDFLQVLF